MGLLGGATQQSWQYDARGHVSQKSYTNIGGLRTAGTFQWSYDSGNRLRQIVYPDNEQASYTYDDAWRPTTLCTTAGPPNCYVTAADYTALDQPADRSLGNGWTQTWTYSSPMQRLQQLQIGLSSSPAFKRSYGYDAVGNVSGITNTLTSEVQSFQYDERDRLTHWSSSVGPVNQSYSYNEIGNLLSKAGVAYTYGRQPPGTGGGGPHAVVQAGSNTYTYDADGNMLAGAGRTYSWSLDNQPTSVTSGAGSEQYSYDGDNERLTRTANGVTTVYLAGIVEKDVQNGSVTTTRKLYPFSGQVVAQRSGSTLYYLHGDQLGSVALMSSSTGGPSALSSQEFDPWGQVRAGGVSQTALNYTGQRLDGSGLLYYHARYYDPVLARWTSADSVVQGASNLAVNVRDMNLPSEQGGKGGTRSPQALNRYSYVLNNPLGLTDPSGHRPADPPLHAVQGDRGEYRDMLSLVYDKMMWTVSGNDDTFNRIRNLRNGWDGGLAGTEGAEVGLGLWASLVRGEGDWDMKRYLREAFSVGATNLYTDIAGTKDVGFSVFGNIFFGYVGRAAGFSTAGLIHQNDVIDTLYDSNRVNLPDIHAIELGFWLWDHYGANLTIEELDEAIQAYVRAGVVHTRASEATHRWRNSGDDSPDCASVLGVCRR